MDLGERYEKLSLKLCKIDWDLFNLMVPTCTAILIFYDFIVLFLFLCSFYLYMQPDVIILIKFGMESKALY